MNNEIVERFKREVQLTGTPAYVAPERLKGHRDIDIRSDFYSLGSVAYNLLTGEDVFDADSPVEICYHIINTEAPRLSEAVDFELPAEFDQLIADCLAKDPEQRSQDADAIIEALKALESACSWNQHDVQLWWQKNDQKIRELLPPE